MKHPLICPVCGDYRYIEYSEECFKDSEGKKGIWINIPFFVCKVCGDKSNLLPEKKLLEFSDEMLREFHEGEFFDMPLKYVFSKLDSEKSFSEFDHLGFNYDPVDYFIIPGLIRPGDDGYLTPVFFDKDLLLYYNGHPDYSVKFTSFSGCNIYYKGEPMFKWGFGINRNGKLFKWLGDLDEDFSEENMEPHLKRFQASNISSDHEILSKFYLSQIPFSPSDAFQSSDNESRLFSLVNKFSKKLKVEFGIDLTKVDIDQLSEYYKSPIMEERDQVFAAFLSLNKYLIENLQEKSIREILLKNGLDDADLKNRDGRKLGSLKLLQLFIERVLTKLEADSLIAPLFVLNDLRQLHGHLSEKSFEERYSSCKKRLGLEDNSSDLQVFEALVKSLRLFYEELIKD